MRERFYSGISSSGCWKKQHFIDMKKNYSYYFETQDRDFIANVKDEPIGINSFFHCHDGYEIYLFLTGDTSFYLEHDGKKLRRGDLILIPPYLFHHCMAVPETPYRRIVINIKSEFCRKKGEDFQRLLDPFYQEDSTHINILHLEEDQIRSIIRTAAQLERVLGEDDSAVEKDMLAEAYLTIILILICRVSRRVSRPQYTTTLPPVLASTFQYLDDHLTEPIRLEDIAASVHLHPGYLNRVFKSYVGMPMQKYLIQKRLALSQQLLKEGKSPIDVCYQSGFNNYSNFSRSFSSHFGMSPKQYQISSRKEYAVARSEFAREAPR